MPERVRDANNELYNIEFEEQKDVRDPPHGR
jgi:hypothetical protein